MSTPARRDDEYRAVSRSLHRRAPSADAPVRVVSEALGMPLADLLDPHAVALTLEPSYALAEIITESIESTTPVVRLVILAGDAWTTRLLSAAGIRPWPTVFQPLRGLSLAERATFVRRACVAARAGKQVCGIKPWRVR